MPVVRLADARVTVTPNATMTTCASPTQGGAHLAVWRVAMEPGSAGPRHTFDVEQVWTVTGGGAEIETDGEQVTLDPGDTVVLPAGSARRIVATDSGFTALVVAAAGARAATPGGEPVLPAWIA